MTASLYARINALAAEVRSLKQDNERLRRHNAELSSELSGARTREGGRLPSPFAMFGRRSPYEPQGVASLVRR
jgi:hypothetical protein